VESGQVGASVHITGVLLASKRGPLRPRFSVGAEGEIDPQPTLRFGLART